MVKQKEEEKFCKDCGQKFKLSTMLNVGRKYYCKECAQEALKEQEKTAKTGNIHILNQQNQTNSGQEFSNGRKILVKNHTVALVLSILFGWAGVDRFYVGHVGLGLLKLFTLSFYGIWWLIDIILFATKNVKYVKWE
jgi:hypothetical protein